MDACFNTQPPEGGWDIPCCINDFEQCFNTQPPEGGWNIIITAKHFLKVSTHSRLKAAGRSPIGLLPIRVCFNTQPPEGGWPQADDSFHKFERFNTQPPEGGWYAPLP